ncbi:MAG: response regulator [Verrucomicrobiota bacterium]|jgi:DNA-binding response OmpR family regulator
MSQPESSVSVLIVEDDEMLRTNLAEILELEGFSYATARNGAEGLEVARRTLPAVILSDASMPVLSGFEMIRALRADERTRHIPVIILSAAIEPERKQLGIDLGATDYIIKPFSVDQLVATIRQRLGANPGAKLP